MLILLLVLIVFFLLILVAIWTGRRSSTGFDPYKEIEEIGSKGKKGYSHKK